MSTIRRTLLGLAAVAALAAVPVVAQQQAPVQTPPNAPDPATLPTPADFTEIVRRLSPSVVGVTTRAAIDDASRESILGDGPLSDFFRRYFDERTPGFRSPQRRRGALGSGFVIDADGHVVTNNHVIENASEIRIVQTDGTSHVATLVGRDQATDIAVLKLEKPLPGVQPVQWGKSSAMQPGAWTIAIGSPFGLGGTVTVGVLSARSRDIHAGLYDDFLQTDASINSGNSGGPLFNAQGRVIGVNTAIVSPSGGNIGIGFAIPSDLARNIVAELIQKGHVDRGYIGAALQAVTPEIATSLGLDKPRGALVASVSNGSPADRGGLKPGDVVVQFNGKDVSSVRDLTRAVAETDAGQNVGMRVLRNGQPVELALSIARRPTETAATGQSSPEQGGPGGSRLGVSLAPLDPATRNRAGLPAGETGVLVQQVMPGSPAADAGLRPGDIIVGAGNTQVDDPSDVAEYWRQSASKSGSPALFRVRRGENYLFVAVKAA